MKQIKITLLCSIISTICFMETANAYYEITLKNVKIQIVDKNNIPVRGFPINLDVDSDVLGFADIIPLPTTKRETTDSISLKTDENGIAVVPVRKLKGKATSKNPSFAIRLSSYLNNNQFYRQISGLPGYRICMYSSQIGEAKIKEFLNLLPEQIICQATEVDAQEIERRLQ